MCPRFATRVRRTRIKQRRLNDGSLNNGRRCGVENREKTCLFIRLMGWRWGNPLYYLAVVTLFLFSVSGIAIGDTYRATWGFLAVALAALPATVEWRKGWIFPWFVKFLIGLTMVMHIGGGIFGWYFDYYPVYDKIAHTVSSSTLALLVFLFLLFLEASSVLHLGRRGIVVTLVVVTFSLGVAWEIVEYLIDARFLSTYFLGVNDSLLDTLFNILGTGYIAYHANEYLKHGSPEMLFGRFIRTRQKAAKA